MREREPGWKAALGAGGRCLTRKRARHAPDRHYDREHAEDEPAPNHWRENPLGAILYERAHTAAVIDQVREEAGNQIERAHSEHVDHVERDAERRALRDVQRRNRQEKRHRRVQHYASEQRESPHGV